MTKATCRDGGATYQPVLLSTPTKGFPVAMYPERTRKVPASDFTADVYNAYERENLEFIREDPARHIGTWLDKNTGIVYLDVSHVPEDESKARRIAIENGGIAYFSFETVDDASVEEARAMTYPPQGEGAFTMGRPTEGEDAGEKVAAWVKQQWEEWDEEEAQKDQE